MTTRSNKQNYIFTLLSGFGGTVLTIIVGIISVPIALNYWKIEKYGLWALLSSILVYLSMSNLGLNSAATILMAKNSDLNIKFKILKRSFIILIVSVLICFLLFILINVYNKDWIMMLGKIPIHLKNEALLTCFVMGIFFFINIPFSLLTSLFQGFQKAYIENSFAACLTVINFVILIIVIHLKGNLVFFALLNGIAILIFSIIKAIYFYLFIYKKLKNKKGKITNSHYISEDTSYKMIFMTGMRFFFIGIAAMVVWNTDNLVISNFLGIGRVTEYSVTFKLYQILFSLILLLNTSIFPLMSKEFGINNWEWLNKVYEKLLIVMALLGGLTWVGSIFFMKDIIYLWAGKNGYAGLLTVFALGGYSYIFGITNLNAGVINSFNYLKGIPIWGAIEALLKFGFSVILLKYLDIGGVALGTFLGALFSVSWILPFIIIKRSKNNMKFNVIFILKHLIFIVLPLITAGILLQLYSSSILIRITSGVLAVSLYLFLCYKIIPIDIKNFLIDNLKTIYFRLKLKV